MKEQVKRTFQRIRLVLWIAVVGLFIGIVPQLRADEHAAPNESSWVQTNGPYGGEILAIHEAPKDMLFAGTSEGGIFRSTDRGDTWMPVNTGLHFDPERTLSIRAFAHNRGMIYAGASNALYASTDGGDTWHPFPIYGKGFVSVSDIIFIGARVYVGTLNKGVWYSDDNGDSWQPVTVTIGDRIYTASLKLNGWVLYSDDGGNSWLPVPPFEQLGAALIRELSSIGTTLVVRTQDTVFRQRTNEDALTAVNDDSVEQRMNAFAAMDNLLFAAGYIDKNSGLFRSDDEGDSWTRIATEEITQSVEAIAVYGTTLYVGTFDDGVFRSDDKGDSWTAVNDRLRHRRISTLLAVDEDTVFAGTPGGGVFRTTDGGDSWVETNTGMTNTTVNELEIVGNRLYTNVSGKIVYTVDGGESWQPVIPSAPIKSVFPPLSVSGGELYICAVRYAPRERGEEIAGIFRVDVENNTLIEIVVDTNWAGINCMEVVDSTFYMGTLNDGVIRWESGSDPSTTNLGLEDHYISMLAGNGESVCAVSGDGIYRLQGEQWEPIHPTDMMDPPSDLRWVGSTLYATFWSGGVFRSVNGGNSWTVINDGLDEASAVSIGTDGIELYVGTPAGVFQWIEAKKRWKPIGSLPYQARSLTVLDGFLYAGTGGGGVYKIQIEEQADQ